MVAGILIAGCVVCAILALRAKRLILSAVWLAGTSALLAVVFYLLGAWQVAVIELSVGAGLVTVLFVFVIATAGDEGLRARFVVPRPLALVLAMLAPIGLAWFVFPLSSTEVASSELPIVDVLWRERGLDVVVQVVLIFAGVLGLLGLLQEAEAPLKQPVAKEVAAGREQELAAMQQKSIEQEVPL